MSDTAVYTSPSPCLRKCLRCGHFECPLCGDWCDVVHRRDRCVLYIDDAGTEPCSCSDAMECRFEPDAPRAYPSEAERAKAAGWLGKCEQTLEDGRVAFLNEWPKDSQ